LGNLQAQRDPNDCPSEEEIKAQWQIIKAEEKALKAERDKAINNSANNGMNDRRSLTLPLIEYLQDIPGSLPALTRADKIQQKVSQRGFDWSEIKGVLAKVTEELQEVEDEILAADPQRLQHEVGDLLFAVVNVARHLSINPEQALDQANRRFSERYSLVAENLAAQGRSLELGNSNQVSEQEMEAAWNEAKQLHPQLLAQLDAANDDA
jgi:ATP diphosphatase